MEFLKREPGSSKLGNINESDRSLSPLCNSNQERKKYGSKVEMKRTGLESEESTVEIQDSYLIKKDINKD
ncbi:hypothetical protein L484_005068 [Morus notabilis]|uniref:Uncharacterized protein n=1 Tax=Morus notabilis TaxID=981085 RepID=W9RKE0_9ROSA|nr:hypothetical protein L484_005068 [Morus notabilis]